MDRTRFPVVRVIVDLIIRKFRLIEEVVLSLFIFGLIFGKFLLIVDSGRMASGESRGLGDRRIKDSLKICYYFRCPARKGLAAGQTIPDFSLGAIRLNRKISGGKRRLEFRGEKFRYGLVGEESAVVSESLG